jgi:potassium/hydrogen antiporter
MTVAAIIFYVGFFVFLSHLLNGIFRRTMLPDVLILILLGLYIGPVLDLVSPANFGSIGPIFTTVTLVIILFEGGLGLNILPMIQSLRHAITLSFLNFAVTMGIAGLIAWKTTSLNLREAFFFGSIIGATSSAVVIPLVQNLRIDVKSRTILILESTLSDVLSIVVSLALLEALKMGKLVPSLVIGSILSSFFLSAILGFLGAYGWSLFLHKIRTIKNSMFTTPSFVFVVYGIVEMLGYNGAIAAFAFGVTIGNIELVKLPFLKKYTVLEPIPLNENEKFFFSEIGFLLKTFFFIYIGVIIKLNDIRIILPGLAITLTLLLSRIPIVRFSISRAFSPENATHIAVMIPKGLVTIVLASLAVQYGIQGGNIIQNLANMVVLFSILFTSVIIFLLDKTAIGKFYGWFFPGAEPPVVEEITIVQVEELRIEEDRSSFRGIFLTVKDFFRGSGTK